MSMGTFHVAQTFLSAVPQVFHPARRVGNSNGCLAADALPTRKSAKRQVGKPALRMGESLMSFVAQTFLSAVPQVFQPAGRYGDSNGCLATDALPTGKSAKRQVGKPALRTGQPLLSFQEGRPDRKGLNIQYPTRNVQFPRGESICRTSCLSKEGRPDRKGLNIQYPTRNVQFSRAESICRASCSSFLLGYSLLDIGYFPIPHFQPIPHFLRERPCNNVKRKIAP